MISYSPLWETMKRVGATTYTLQVKGHISSPKLSIAEDPVCGSAHCQIADYWSRELGKKEIKAYQASKRGGYLDCTLQDIIVYVPDPEQ